MALKWADGPMVLIESSNEDGPELANQFRFATTRRTVWEEGQRCRAIRRKKVLFQSLLSTEEHEDWIEIGKMLIGVWCNDVPS